jgi:hypothetical protein
MFLLSWMLFSGWPCSIDYLNGIPAQREQFGWGH